MDLGSKPAAISQWMVNHRKTVFLILAIFLAIQISPNWKPDADGVNYLSIARNVGLHGKLERQGMTHLYYAPGYPVLISPAFWFGPRPFVEIGIIHFIFALLMMLAIYQWFARYDPAAGMFVTAMVVVNVGFCDLYRQTRAEVAFMAALMGAAVLLASAAEAKTRGRFILIMVGAAVLVTVTCSIRQVGFLLAGGFGITSFVRALLGRLSWKRAIAGSFVIAASAMAVVIALIIYDSHTAKASGPQEMTYLENRRDATQSLPVQIAEGFRRQTAEIGRLIVPGMWKAYAHSSQWLNVNTIFYLFLFVFIAVGWWKLIRTTLDPLVATFPFYFALFVCWPFDQGTRFTVPMLPVLAASVWFLFASFSHKRQIAFAVLILIHLSVSIGMWITDALTIRRWNAEWSSMQQISQSLPQGPGIFIAREKPQERWLILSYISDRRFIWQAHGELVPTRARWVASPVTSPDTPGFEMIKVVNEIKIEQRRAVDATTQSD